jgi:hypothetical protein
MKTTLNNLNLKKGSKVFLYGNWNGSEQTTIDFFIQEYTVHSIGKKRCYLLIDGDINSKKHYDTNHGINAALSLDEALNNCRMYIPKFIENEIEHFNSRIKDSNANTQYINLMKKSLNNVITAQQRIILNTYSKNTKEYFTV